MELWRRIVGVEVWTHGALEVLRHVASVAHTGMELWRRTAGMQTWRHGVPKLGGAPQECRRGCTKLRSSAALEALWMRSDVEVWRYGAMEAWRRGGKESWRCAAGVEMRRYGGT